MVMETVTSATAQRSRHGGFVVARAAAVAPSPSRGTAEEYTMRTQAMRLAGFAVAVLALVSPVAAQGLGELVRVHGFGGWAYGETNGLDYLYDTDGGRYDNVDFALNIAMLPREKSRDDTIIGKNLEMSCGGRQIPALSLQKGKRT
jgi:hypothetical protein